MKKQNKTPEKKLNKMEKSNLSDAEFKILVIRMLKELSEDLNSIKKIQSETKNTLIKIKNKLQGINSRVDEAENQISNLEHKEAKKQPIRTTRTKKNLKNEDSVSSLWTTNIPTFTSQGCQREKKKSKKLEICLKKIMKENVPNLVKEIDMQVQEAQRVPNKMDAKRPAPRHIIIKMLEVKGKDKES